MSTVETGTMPARTAFRSILTPTGEVAAGGRRTADDVLHDLALDQVLARTIEKAPAAADAFRTLCADESEIAYRHEVFAALGDADLRTAVDTFLEGMRRSGIADGATSHPHYPFEHDLWRLSAVLFYTGAVTALGDALADSEAAAGSRALRGLSDHLTTYRSSPAFTDLQSGAAACRDQMDAVRYNVLIRDARLTIAPTDDEDDLRRLVLDTFARFRTREQAARVETFPDRGLDHVQAWVLEKAAQVHPEAFARLRRFVQTTDGYRDATIELFTAEIWFYLAWLDHIAPLRRAGLPFCTPVVSAEVKDLDARDTFDVALAGRMVADGGDLVRNDLRLTGGERVIVISGPNQGGKSTTARAFGQLHHLAAIGCPVPGRSVRIFLCDQVLTAFEREEQLDDLAGRLGAEIGRMHEMIETATDRTVLVLNEVFSSTALQDARILTRDILERILAKDALAVCVTFIDESRIDERTVSMVSTVDPHDPARRTFRIERRVADGRAYARALAAVHGLTGPQITERITAQMAERAAGDTQTEADR
ncbi:MutS-related protein [Microbacterium luticocti]|uniref:MutS-related protein n=1 Tax=Microbacterium luticocti TaxID=451764 RepID=UPI00041CFCE0|nr:DNA mismatch repair protein MutS [Microbacterium luticocti]